MRNIIPAILDLIFPPRCQVCNEYLAPGNNSVFCEICLQDFIRLIPPLCRICGCKIQGGSDAFFLCGDCLRRRPPFVLARSLFSYNENLQQLIHRLKFLGDRTVLRAIEELLANEDFHDFSGCDLIVPVPLHINKLRRRGFNQSLVLAQLFFPGTGQRIAPDLLKRNKDGVSQTVLGGMERRRSLKNHFSIKSEKSLQGATVCLVDDVYTTGTTVSECSKTLLAAGAESVKVLTLARVDKPEKSRGS